MKIKFLRESQAGLEWWRFYYKVRFPQGKGAAYAHFSKILAHLKRHPLLGQPAEIKDLRKLPIPNTPFVIFYLVKDQTLEIVQVRDGRREADPGFQEEQAPIK